jgi:hypothetical protein
MSAGVRPPTLHTCDHAKNDRLSGKNASPNPLLFPIPPFGAIMGHLTSMMECAVAETPEQIAENVVLKDPALAAFLAWLVPGLGHWHQGRHAKAALFFVCIMGTFVIGVFLGGNQEVGWGRTVYFSWRDNDRRLNFFCQLGIGLPAMPALIQANRMANHQKVWWGGFMSPPRLGEPGPSLLKSRGLDPAALAAAIKTFPNLDQPNISELHLKLGRFFELGTVFTMIAGLLNILAIYDAWGGPVVMISKKEERPSISKTDVAASTQL